MLILIREVKEKHNVDLIEIKKIVKDINSGRINNMKSAVDRYLKDIFPNKKFLETKEIIYDFPSYILKKVFDNFEYAFFGSYDPEKRKQEYEKPDVVTSRKSSKKRQQKSQGLKIMAPKQMITKLRILLAQLKAGNNSQKLNNEIREIVYSLCRSKNLSKTIYNRLISAI